MKARIRHHILRDYKLTGWEEHIQGQWHYRQLLADPNWFKGWISYDAVTWNPEDRKVYCGLNSLDGDLLYAFDPATGEYECKHTQRWSDKFDSKIHRTLLRNPHDGCLYFGTSLLHDTDQQHEAPGGKLVKFDPRTGDYDVLGIPFPHQYLQSIAADWERGILYAFSYPAEFILRFDLATRASRVLGYVGNACMFAQAHNGVVDKHGNLWGTYAETRAFDETSSSQPIRLFKYHPDTDRFTWYDHGLSRKADRQQLLPDPPRPPGAESLLAHTRHRDDFAFCDAMLYDGDRTIYAGTVAGVLCRIDTETARVEKIAGIMATGRFPALAMDPQGVLYGGGGMNGHTQLIRWDPRSDQIEDYGRLADERTGEVPARIHEIAVDDQGRVYLGENDNHHRSSYLWSVAP
jgi:sugar lactone lactonase YvrE